MRGYLRASGVIHQCCRCFALRDIVGEPGECPSCRRLLGVASTVTRPLSFADVSDDATPTLQVVIHMAAVTA